MSQASSGTFVEQIVARLAQVLPERRPLPLHEPSIGAGAFDRVRACLESGWVSSAGPHTTELEGELCRHTGVAHAVATVNGTAALHASLLVAGVRPGDEVLLPALTFVGTANPVAAMGAVPHFVDASPATLGVDPDALEAHLAATAEMRGGVCVNRRTGRAIRVLIVVHVLGHVAEMPRLCDIADRHGLVLIEDAAEALGSRRDGLHAGAWGTLTALSFNGNKIVTTGGGGAILCADPELAKRARHLTTTARCAHRWAIEHDEVAFNYRMPDINAALGLAQLDRLPELLASKRRLAAAYRAALADLPGVESFPDPAGCESNAWLNLLLVPDAATRDAVLERAHADGLLARPFWRPLSELPMYTGMPSASLPNTRALYERGVCLPSSAGLDGSPGPDR